MDSLETSFTYDKLDEAAYKMIDEGIGSLVELFPYALLFNEKLFQISVKDKRTEKKFDDFVIKKLPK